MTPGQKIFIREALYLPGETIAALNKDEVSEVISAVKKIRKESSDVPTRQSGLRKLAQQIIARKEPQKCSNCHKPVAPINDINSCSC